MLTPFTANLHRKLYALLVLLVWLASPAVGQKKIRIACVGNSITAGVGVKNKETESYPAQLENLLGEAYEVMNFGVSGRTVLRKTTAAYVNTDLYKKALISSPDIVFIKLGTNDSRLPYRLQIDEFSADYKALIRDFQQLPSHPRIILLLPVASYLSDTTRQTDAAITQLIIPRIRQIAFEEKLELIDLHSITSTHPDWFPDKLHPAAAGYTVLAKRLAEALTAKTVPQFDLLKSLKEPYKITSFHGYDCAEFTFMGRQAKVVKPRVVAKGKPWIWRARFWGHEPQTDIALLDRGFHLVYCDASELFGNPEAIALWNNFYKLLRKSGLAKKAVMEGMSRGGVYVYNWAAENPRKVACVYADAPVLDLKSWPGGKGTSNGSPSDWEKFKKDYGFSSEEEALRFKGNPIDKVAQIVKGKYPMLHVVGDADDVVPVKENTGPFEQKVLAAGGNITVIHKPDVQHHPHSLADPTPIVALILKALQESN